MAFITTSSDLLFSKAVVDNSVMMRWLFHDGSESDQQYAQTVLQQIQSQRLSVIVPYIWVYESAFVVRYDVKQGNIAYETGQQHLTALFDLSQVMRGEEMPKDLFAFAHTHTLSAYDASYAMLALEQKIPLATLNKGILKAAEKMSLELFSGH